MLRTFEILEKFQISGVFPLKPCNHALKVGLTAIRMLLGVDPGEIAYNMEVLRKMRRIKVVDEKKRRGAVEVFYKAVSRAYLDEFDGPPFQIRRRGACGLPYFKRS